MTPLEEMLIEHVGLRDETEALYLLRRDVEAKKRQRDHAWPHWRQLDEVRADVVLPMAFNLGSPGSCGL